MTRHSYPTPGLELAVRLMESLKPDCACALQRKTPGNQPVTFDGPLSPVRFKGKTCRIAAIFNDSCSNAALFLCTPDCVAEGEGFEPPVPFQVQRFSRPPVSTTHASLRWRFFTVYQHLIPAGLRWDLLCVPRS